MQGDRGFAAEPTGHFVSKSPVLEVVDRLLIASVRPGKHELGVLIYVAGDRNLEALQIVPALEIRVAFLCAHDETENRFGVTLWV